jgi:hypothetical protein
MESRQRKVQWGLFFEAKKQPLSGPQEKETTKGSKKK